MNILEQYNKNWLELCGLDSNDIAELDRIFNKLEIPEKDIEEFNKAIDSTIPFEGGIGFNEAMIGAKIDYNNIKTWKR